MSIPAHIADRVAEALDALYRHPERALLPWYRYAIYAALADAERRAARAWLDIAAARRALFCWQPYARRVWPRDWLQPADLLAVAERQMRGEVGAADIGALIRRAHALADIAGEPPNSRHYCAWCVFEASLRALESAWNCAADQSDTTGCADDASAYAAIAIAGGSWAAGRWDWQTEDTRLRRAVFWEWWLREGVPAAWEALCLPLCDDTMTR